MEFFFLCGLVFYFSISLASFFLFYNHHTTRVYPLPAGEMGWPVVGDSFEFFQTGWNGYPENFIFDRLNKYTPSQVFKTFILREKVVFYLRRL
ncbi:hypothetical protein SOVF_107670 [Spinacia oleracea]|nr:hypothetical protein SOVF_107670 [Spinacia oleracea]